MTEYELPMNDGKVDFDKILTEITQCPSSGGQRRILKAIDANARAGERERCEDACWAEHKKAGDGTDGAYRLERAILAIRNMGDE